jgi:hypothetical protein
MRRLRVSNGIMPRQLGGLWISHTTKTYLKPIKWFRKYWGGKILTIMVNVKEFYILNFDKKKKKHLNSFHRNFISLLYSAKLMRRM